MDVSTCTNTYEYLDMHATNFTQYTDCGRVQKMSMLVKLTNLAKLKRCAFHHKTPHKLRQGIAGRRLLAAIFLYNDNNTGKCASENGVRLPDERFPVCTSEKRFSTSCVDY